MKKANFKEAIDQIESALSGQDPAPNSYEVTKIYHIPIRFIHFKLFFIIHNILLMNLIKIPFDKSNATFDSTVTTMNDTTLDTTTADADSTKFVDESNIEDESENTNENANGNDEAESEDKFDNNSEGTQENEVTTATIEVIHSYESKIYLYSKSQR